MAWCLVKHRDNFTFTGSVHYTCCAGKKAQSKSMWC